MVEKRLDAYPEYTVYLDHYYLLRDRILFLAGEITGTGYEDRDIPVDATIDIDSTTISVNWTTPSGCGCCPHDNHFIDFPISYLTRDIEEINKERLKDMFEKYQADMEKRGERDRLEAEENKKMDVYTLKKILKKYPDIELEDI